MGFKYGKRAKITLNRDLPEPEFVSQALHRHSEVLGQIETQRDFTKVTEDIRRHEAKLVEATSEPFGKRLTPQAFLGRLR